MIEYRNSTDIPDKLVGIALEFSAACLTNLKLPDQVIIKNKSVGRTVGQWGWYFPKPLNKIVLIVPRVIRPGGHRYLSRYTKVWCTINSRAEFVVSVLAHELRHCWQWQNWDTPLSRWKLKHGDFLARQVREVDAERFEYTQTAAWRRMLEEQVKAAASVQS